MRSGIGIICATYLYAFAVQAQGTPAPQEEITFHPVSELSYDPTKLALIGSRPAVPDSFKATFYSVQGNSRCTSTLVGPRVLLTAAHCVKNNATARIKSSTAEHIGVCTHAPEYAANATADYALCLFGSGIPNIRYERININADRVKVGQELLLSGFGCTKSDGSGGNDGVYRIGESRIQVIPMAPSNDIITKDGAALCFGDSGGPAFLFTDAQKRNRLQVAVNSRGNIRDLSALSSLSTETAINFLRTWSAQHNVVICGVHDTATGCR